MTLTEKDYAEIRRIVREEIDGALFRTIRDMRDAIQSVVKEKKK